MFLSRSARSLSNLSTKTLIISFEAKNSDTRLCFVISKIDFSAAPINSDKSSISLVSYSFSRFFSKPKKRLAKLLSLTIFIYSWTSLVNGI